MNKIDTLDPEFKAKIEQLITAIEGITDRTWIVTAGRRTMAEQSVLYSQGRMTPGNIVTKAPAGSSAHNFGLAADLASLKPGTQDIDWSDSYTGWLQMANLATEMGLVAGMFFKSITDRPHVESADWRTVQREWKAGKITIE